MRGPAVLVCNHVSFMDALVIAGCCHRPVRFVMDHRIFKLPVLSFVFRTAGAVPIAPARKIRSCWNGLMNASPSIWTQAM